MDLLSLQIPCEIRRVRVCANRNQRKHSTNPRHILMGRKAFLHSSIDGKTPASQNTNYSYFAVSPALYRHPNSLKSMHLQPYESMHTKSFFSKNIYNRLLRFTDPKPQTSNKMIKPLKKPYSLTLNTKVMSLKKPINSRLIYTSKCNFNSSVIIKSPTIRQTTGYAHVPFIQRVKYDLNRLNPKVDYFFDNAQLAPWSECN